MVKPIERVLRSGLFGPWDRPDIEASTSCPPALNPARHPAWGVDSFVFFPNFMLLVWAPNWYLTYHYWPTSYNTHIFEGTLYFVPPKNATERLRQELAAVTFKEYALQDGNTLEATQTMLESRAVDQFPLNDQEILLRHLHRTAREYVADYQQPTRTPRRIRPRRERGDADADVLPDDFADLEPFADWCAGDRGASATPSGCRAPWTSCRPSTTPRSPGCEDALAYLDQFELDALPEDADAPAVALLLAGQRLVPGRGVAPAAGARQRGGQHGRGRRAGRLSRDA